MRRRFWLKLALFLLPLVLLYSVPLATMVPSGEVLTADAIAEKHLRASSSSLYGPAYTNPDKRYKLRSALLRDVPVMSVGTSRVMQFCSGFFEGGEATFYNAGGLVSRLSHYRRALAHLPDATRTRYLVLGLDQWSFNDAWGGVSDDPGVEAEYAESSDALGNLRTGLSVWPDFVHGKVDLGKLVRPSESLGVNARVRGNGFRHDGSYMYADILAHPEEARDHQFKDSLARLHDGRDRFEAGVVPSERALSEARLLFRTARERGFSVVAFLPPFAPTVGAALRASGNHQYLEALPARLREVTAAEGVPFYDFTSCEALGCTDAEFIDGFHGGDTVYARLTLEMARGVPWLGPKVSPALAGWLEHAAGRPAP